MFKPLLNPLAWTLFCKAFGLAGLVVVAGALPANPVFLSIGTFMVIGAGFFSTWPREQWKKLRESKAILFFGIIFIIHVLSGFWTENSAGFAEDLRIKAPMLFFTYALAILGPYSRREISLVLATLVLSVFVIGTGTVIQYFTHYEYILHQIAIAKPVYTFGGLNHIYFSIALFSAVFSAAWLVLRGETIFFRWEKYLFGALCIALAAYQHILTTRTGIVAFYGGVMMAAFLYIIRTRKYLLGFGILALIVSMPVIAWNTLPGIRNRFESTLIDLDAVYYDIDPNDYSIATRVEAWRTAVHIFKRSPLIGVGMADVQDEMKWQYSHDESRLEDRNREMPHNQFLEILAGLGILGFGIVSFAWFYGVISKRKTFEADWLFPAVWMGFTLAMMVESIMERQVGVALMVLFWGLLCTSGNQKKSTETAN